MIERDIGDRRHPEVEDVGAVEAATETDLTDQHLGVRLARGEDPPCGQDLEPRRLQLLGERVGCLPNAGDERPELRLADRYAVTDDPLGVRDEVRAREQHRPIPGGAADGIDGGAHRSLAVGARYQCSS